MTNWNTFTITKVEVERGFNGVLRHLSHLNHVTIDLNSDVDFRDGSSSTIYCQNCYPFNTYQQGDRIIINLDKLKYVNEGWGLHTYDDGFSVFQNLIGTYREVLKTADLPTVAGIANLSEIRKFATEAQRNGSTEGECLASQGSIQYNNWVYEKLAFNKNSGYFSYEQKNS